MKIIISPAKKMLTDNDVILPKQLPVFIEKAEHLRKYLKSLSYDELKSLLACNDEIASLNYERYQYMDLNQDLSPAVLSYDGIQYKYMAPQVFEDRYFEYIEKHLRIISGFYGILRPFDGITPYRLEMQARLKTGFCKNLYDYWRDDIYRELTADDNVILNLASNEYSRTVSKYLTGDIQYITCIFGEMISGRIKEKGVYVKMARGEMVRYMAENDIEDLEKIKEFDRLGFKYNDSLSEKNKFVFVKET
ncbi:MAG: peroxide stress protein YaaA [Candidatus Ornithomonoglobus sp.]